MVFASALRSAALKETINEARSVLSTKGLGAIASQASGGIASPSSVPLYPDAVLKAPETRTSKLDNGVRVATEAGGGQLASLTISVDVGSRFETAGNNGTCSALGAAAFKGKEAAVAAMGGKFSVNVDRENMTYNATVLKADVPKAMEVLSSAVKASSLTAETLDACKASVQQQLAAVRANPQLNLMDHLHDAAFLDTTMGLPVIGTPESVESLTVEGLKEFAEKSAVGPRIVVAGAGAIDQGSLADFAGSAFGSLASTPATELDATLQPSYFIGSDKRIRFDSMKTAHIAFCFQAPPQGSKDTYAFELMKAIMGTYDDRDLVSTDAGSQWRQHLAELNLAKQAAPFYLPYKSAGLFGVSSVVTDNNIDNYMWYTLWNMLYMCHKLTDYDVELAKTHLLKTAGSKVSTCEGKAADIAQQIMQNGRRHPPAEYTARIDAITTAEVKKVAYEYISDQDHALTAVGPIHELPDYNWIRRRSYWLRY